MATRPVLRLGELLLDAGAITREQLSAALALQARAGGRLGSNLIELGAVDERTIAHVLAQQLGISSASAAQLDRAPKGVLSLVPRSVAERLRAIPVRLDGERLWVALADPLDREAIATLERESKYAVRAMVAPDVLIDFALEKHYGVRRRARVVEVRDAELLEVEPIDQAAVYEPFAGSAPAAAVRAPAGPPSLGFLDDRPAVPPPAAPSRPPPTPPTAARTGAALDADALRDRLLGASTDDEVFERLLEALRPTCARQALLLVRGGVLMVHRARGVDLAAIAKLRIGLADAAEIAQILAQPGATFGPLPAALGPLVEQLGGVGLCLPITMGRRALGLIAAGQLDPALGTKAADLTRIVRMIDLALHLGHLRARLAKA